MRYVKLNDKKQPTHSLDKWYSYDEVKNERNVGILLDEPYVVIDVDKEEHFKAILDIIYDYKIKCRVMKTDRGGHIWFKSLKPFKNHVGTNTPLTIRIDIRSFGKKSLVVVKKKGKWRKWLQDDKEIDTYPFWLLPTRSKSDLFGYQDHDGRNTGLFGLLIPLVKLKLTREEVRDTFDMINYYVFCDPLEDSEIDAMLEDDSVFDQVGSEFLEEGHFYHDKFALYMTHSYHVKYHAGELYLYKDGCYQRGRRDIEQIMIQDIPQLLKRNRGETLSYMELLDYEVEIPSVHTFSTLDGTYNLVTKEWLPHSPLEFHTSKFNCYYNPEAYDKHVDTMLDKLTGNDMEIRDIIEEMLGYILMRHVRYQKAFLLLGPGGNGKSTFLEMIGEWVGQENISSLLLHDLSDKFRGSQIVDKIVNLGDDISDEIVKDSAMFKSLSTGEVVTLEEKNLNPFNYVNTAKLIFTANSMPLFHDKSHGLSRRWIFIPFDVPISENDKDYDPDIRSKLATQDAKSYLLNLAIEGARRLMKNKKFTHSKRVDELLTVFKMDNDNVLQWVDTVSPNEEILNQPSGLVYTKYKFYCVANGFHPRSIRNFNKSLRTLVNLKLLITTHKGDSVQVWRKIHE